MGVAGPLDVGVCDFFESGLGSNWTVNSTSGFAGTSSATSFSPGNSLFLNGGVVNVTSTAVDTSDVSFSNITLWIRRGSDTFSEDPDGGENLVVEYLDNGGTWVGLETFTGNGGPGQQFARTYNIPAGGRHAGFQLRFRMTGGSGSVWDYWHIDDVCFVQNPDPILQVTKVANVLSDPVSGTTSPLAMPGAIAQYTVSVTNQGVGSVDAGTVEITDVLPANTALFVSTAGGDPVSFVDGSPASGLNFTFASDVEFSNQPNGGAPYNYSPSPDVDGFDPAVTGIRVNPGGPMNGATVGGDPSFRIVFRIRIQ